MLRSLFGRLTAGTRPGAIPFEAVVAEARQRHWYVEGRVPDTVDGRFAVLATVMALAIIHLEDRGADADSIVLTERFIAAMDSEHRQLGVGDPAIGKTVRKLVGALAARIELWRKAIDGGDRRAAARRSLYRDSAIGDDSLDHSVAQVDEMWQRLSDGRFG